MSAHTTADATAPAYRAISQPTNNVIEATRGVYIGGTGNLVVIMAGDKSPNANGTKVTFNGVTAGIVLPIQVIWIDSTSTCTNLLCLY